MTSYIRANELDLFIETVSVDDINAIDPLTGKTLLQIAADENKSKFFDFIIKKVFDVDAEQISVDGEIAEIYIQRKAFLKSEYHAGYSRLHVAVMDGEPQVIHYIFKRGLCNPNYADVPIGTALHLAILLDRLDCIDALLDYDIDVDIVNKHQQTALEMAIEHKLDSSTLARLFGRSDNIDGPRYMGFTLLQVAIINNWEVLIGVLLNAGADMLLEIKHPHERSMTETVADICSRPTLLPLTTVENSITLCLKLNGNIATGLQKRLGSAALRSADGYGNSLLHLAAGLQNVELCRTLIDHGADVNFLNYSGANALQEMFRLMGSMNHSIKKPVAIGTLLIQAGIHVMMDDWNDANILKDVLSLNHEKFFILALENAVMIDFSCIDFQALVKRRWFTASNQLITYMPEMLRGRLIDLKTVQFFSKHADVKDLEILLPYCSEMVLNEVMPYVFDNLVEKNDTSSFKLLLGAVSVHKLGLLSNGETLLTNLIKNQKQEFIDTLLDSNSRDVYIHMKNAKGESPLEVAIVTRNTTLVEIFILEYGDFNEKISNGDTIFRLLFTTFTSDDDSSFVEKIAKIMITGGAVPYIPDSHGIPSIDYCSNPNIKERIISFAKKRNATLNSKEKTSECKVCLNNPIECALECGHVYCNACAKRCTRCPTCRLPVKSIKKIFF